MKDREVLHQLAQNLLIKKLLGLMNGVYGTEIMELVFFLLYNAKYIKLCTLPSLTGRLATVNIFKAIEKSSRRFVNWQKVLNSSILIL